MRMTARLFILFTFACSSVAGAGDARGPSEPASKELAEFRKLAGVKFAECSDKKCLEAALPRCSPVHLLVGLNTLEGTPATFDYFVVKHPAGCRVVKFADFTKDYWGGCKVRKRVCPNLKAADSDDPDRLGCSPGEVLYTASVCKNPMAGP